MAKLYPPKLFYCKHPHFAEEKNDVLEMKSLFEKAVAESASMSVKPGYETLLHLYSLYKQAIKGDINVAPPGDSYDCCAKAKYNAWASLRGKPVKDAQTEYIRLVYKLKNLYTL